MLSPVNLRQLKFFVAVAEQRSFRRAAEICHITQPPLSRAIAGLESHLGVRLFERNQRSVTLTPAGQAMLESTRRCLAAAEDAVNAARGAAQPLKPTIRIGVVSAEYAQMTPLTTLTARLRAEGERLEFKTMQAHEGVAALHANQLEAAVVYTPVDGDTRGLHVQAMRQDNLAVALKPSHPLAARDAVMLRELATERLILFPRFVMPQKYDEVTGFFRRSRRKPVWIDGNGSLFEDLAMVARGEGVAIVPEEPTRVHTNLNLVVKPLVNPTVFWSVVLITRPEHAKRFRDELQRQA